MPGVSCDSRASHISANTYHSSVEQLLDENYACRDEQRERRRKVVRRANLTNRQDRNPHCRAEQHQRDNNGGKWLGLTVAIWVVFVGRTGGNAQAHPHYHRGENVG